MTDRSAAAKEWCSSPNRFSRQLNRFGRPSEPKSWCSARRAGKFNQAEALRLSKAEQVILVCGRYEGIDERVTEHLATAEISIGDFILSGGEIAAAMVVDAVTRYVPGVVGKEESILRDSFSDPAAATQLVEHPHYTRPAEFRGWKVPEVLISGDHEAVRKWRHEAALKKTEKNRPDLLENL